MSSDEYKVRIIRITFHRERHRYHRDNFLFSQGVAERGVSVVATKNIIDAVKVEIKAEQHWRILKMFQAVWVTMNRDLEEAKSSIEVAVIMILIFRF